MQLSVQLKPKHEDVSNIIRDKLNITKRETVAVKHDTVQKYAQQEKLLSSPFFWLNGYPTKKPSNSLESLLSQCHGIKVWLVIHMELNTLDY